MPAYLWATSDMAVIINDAILSLSARNMSVHAWNFSTVYSF